MDKFGEAQLNQTLLLKTTMDVVPNLVFALLSAESGRLRKIKMVIILNFRPLAACYCYMDYVILFILNNKPVLFSLILSSLR